MPDLLFLGDLILPNFILPRGAVLARDGRIVAVGPAPEIEPMVQAGRK